MDYLRFFILILTYGFTQAGPNNSTSLATESSSSTANLASDKHGGNGLGTYFLYGLEQAAAAATSSSEEPASRSAVLVTQTFTLENVIPSSSIITSSSANSSARRSPIQVATRAHALPRRAMVKLQRRQKPSDQPMLANPNCATTIHEPMEDLPSSLIACSGGEFGWNNAFGNHIPLTYEDLEPPIRTDVYKCMSQCSYEATDLDNGQPYWTSVCPTIWDDYSPVIVFPIQITTLQSAWKSCGLDEYVIGNYLGLRPLQPRWIPGQISRTRRALCGRQLQAGRRRILGVELERQGVDCQGLLVHLLMAALERAKIPVVEVSLAVEAIQATEAVLGTGVLGAEEVQVEAMRGIMTMAEVEEALVMEVMERAEVAGQAQIQERPSYLHYSLDLVVVRLLLEVIHHQKAIRHQEIHQDDVGLAQMEVLGHTQVTREI
ncbi:MAG: hypothetical protein M1820_001828 [Bogoriella megaspora]|nr:MAG: hypothetical protein M1820_001828 [Bogoriella megaspora]